MSVGPGDVVRTACGRLVLVHSAIAAPAAGLVVGWRVYAIPRLMLASMPHAAAFDAAAWVAVPEPPLAARATEIVARCGKKTVAAIEALAECGA